MDHLGHHPRNLHEAEMTLPLPVSIALIGDELHIEFPDGHKLRVRDEPRGWQQLRDICVARQIATSAGIGTEAKPIQHMADAAKISSHLRTERDPKIAEARKALKALGL